MAQVGRERTCPTVLFVLVTLLVTLSCGWIDWWYQMVWASEADNVAVGA